MDRDNAVLDGTFSLIEATESIKAITDLFLGWVGQFGIEHATAGPFPDEKTPDEDNVYLSSWPCEWLDRYIDNYYFFHDPVCAASATTPRPFSWDDIIKGRSLSRSEKLVFDEASEFGLHDGFVVPVYELNRPPAFATLAGEKPEINRRDRKILHLVSIYLYSRVKDLSGGESRSRATIWPTLTQRERECLTWVAVGKTDWEISQILLISERTSTFHIANAMRKLGVATRAQAVTAALRKSEIVI